MGDSLTYTIYFCTLPMSGIGQWLSYVSQHQNHLRGLLTHGVLGPTPRVSDSVGLGWGPRFYMSQFHMMLRLKN